MKQSIKAQAKGVSKITCGFSKINCGMDSWANGNSPKSVVGRNRWILNKKMVKKSGNRVTFGCLIWYKTYFLYYLNFGPFTACFLYGPLVLSVRKQTAFHGLGTARIAAFFRWKKRKRFRICSKFPYPLAWRFISLGIRFSDSMGPFDRRLSRVSLPQVLSIMIKEFKICSL